MAFTEIAIKALDAPLDASNVKKREQAGRKFSYIEGWHAIAEANRIFGFDGWTRETVEIRSVSERERKIGPSQKDGWSVSYIAKVRITAHDVIREGVGSGHGIDADLGLAHESAIKEAETDAMKRALMTFGNPFGLALYDKQQTNVASEPSSDELYVKAAFAKIAAFSTCDDINSWWMAEKDNRKRMLSPEQIGILFKSCEGRAEEIEPKQRSAA